MPAHIYYRVGLFKESLEANKRAMAVDEAYFDKVAFWTTPTKNCGDDRGAVCKDYSEWVQAWTEVKG